MQLRAEEISAIIKKQIQNYEKAALTTETGTVLSVGDGIARIYGLEGAMAGELFEFPGPLMGLVLNLESDNVGGVGFGGVSDRERGVGRSAHWANPRRWRGRGARRASGECPRSSDRRKGPHRDAPSPTRRAQGSGNPRPPAGQRAATDRPQGHRQHGPDRPWAARAHHRRSSDGKDRGRRRHHHQPEGPGRLLLLRSHWAKAVDRRERG